MADTTPEVDTGIPEPDGHAAVIDTDYEVGQDNIETQIGPFGLDIHNPVFLISGITIVLFVFYALVFQEQADALFNGIDPSEDCAAGGFCDLGLRSYLTSTYNWFFLSAANFFVLFCLALIVLPVGKVRLGGADAVPDYTYVGWFAMLRLGGGRQLL